MSEWKSDKLGNISSIVDSLHKTPKKYYDNGYPMVRVTDVKKGTLNLSSTLKVDKHTFIEFSKKHTPKKGDIIFTRVGSYGNSCIVGNEINFCLGQNTVYIIPKINSYFLYYFLNSPDGKYEIESSVGGSTQPTISLKSIKDYDIPVPPLEEQKAIAEVLSSLDDKIDLLHRQNKTLEGLAQTLFRQWFIEEAKDDWEEKPLKDFCIKITKGTTPTTLKKQFVDSGINFIKVNCIDNNGNYLKDKFNFIDEETNDLLNRSQLKNGDILYSIAGTIGRISIVPEDILPANINQALAIIRVDKDKINPNYIRYCIQDKNITFELHSKIVHAVQPNLSLGEISNTPIPSPDEKTLNKFFVSVNPLEGKIAQNKKQIKTLENMRDTLLPKLMNGEVRIKNG